MVNRRTEDELVSDEILAEIDRVLEPNAAEFVESYVQRAGNGGAQYFALAERIADAIGLDATRELFIVLQRALVANYGITDVRQLVRLHFGRDIARFLLEGEVIDPIRLAEGLGQVVDSDPVASERLPTESEFRLEITARQHLGAGEIEAGISALRDVFETKQTGRGRLADEFGFLLDPEVVDVDRTSSRLSVWAAFAATSPGEQGRAMRDIDDVQVEVLGAHDESAPKPSATSHERPGASFASVGPPSSSQQAGDSLESAFTNVLRRLFEVQDDDIAGIWERLRRQAAGTQYGHDIQLDAQVSGSSVKCHIECKNYGRPLTVGDVAEKILQIELYWSEKKIDHFIIVSPRYGLSNELDLLIQARNARLDRPFSIQAWTPENRIEELFALEPQAFEAIYGRTPPPADETVVARWRDRLRPLIRGTAGLANYLTTPSLHCLAGEDASEFAYLYDHPLEVLAKRGGRPERLPLAMRLTDWLASENRRTALLLGEFGDGKSFASYRLTRDLASEYLADPQSGTFAIRLPLRDLRSAGTVQQLLNGRLTSIGMDPSEWIHISGESRTLVILDGLDEVSTRMDRATIAENFRLVSNAVQYLSNSRVLLTSRAHYFEARRDQERFFEQLDDPTVLTMAPVPRVKTQEYLATYAREHDLSSKLQRIQRLYDPIGLAAKPLFLQMIKSTLDVLPDDEFSEVILYETYVSESLTRKIELLQDDQLTTLRAEAREGMLGILTRVAVEQALNGGRPVDLRHLGSQYDLAAELWRMSQHDDASSAAEDAQGRVGIRSLLVPATRANAAVPGEVSDLPVDRPHDPGWKVVFFHRSMGQYFLARAIVDALTSELEKARQLLTAAPIAVETVEFVRQIVGGEGRRPLLTTLESLACSALEGTRFGFLGGNALTLLTAIAGRPERERWEGLILDGADLRACDLSGLSFEGSSLRNANLDNCDLSGVSFRNADLTGVRFDETAAVTHVSAGRGAGTLLACYTDGTVLEWNYGAHGVQARPLLRSVEDLVSASWLPSGDLLVNRAREVELYDSKQGSARRVLRVRKLSDIEDFVIGHDSIVTLSSASQGSILSEWDYSGPVAVRALRLPASFDRLVPLEKGNIVLRSRHGACRVLSLASGGLSEDAGPIDFGQPMAARISDDCVQLFVGDEEGVVTWMNLFTNDGLKGGPQTPLAAHDGWIASIAELRDGLIATGGVDRTVSVIEPTADGTLIERQSLRLSLPCAGVVTSGMRGESEREALERLRDHRIP
jgi:ubiquitin-like protein Pup